MIADHIKDVYYDRIQVELILKKNIVAWLTGRKDWFIVCGSQELSIQRYIMDFFQEHEFDDDDSDTQSLKVHKGVPENCSVVSTMQILHIITVLNLVNWCTIQLSLKFLRVFCKKRRSLRRMGRLQQATQCPKSLQRKSKKPRHHQHC